MRDIYHGELDAVGTHVVEMTQLVARAMDRGTQALLDANLSLANDVVAEDAEIDALRAELSSECFQLILLQAPVATDLRVLVSTMHLTADLERMGDLVVHIAKIVRMRFPDSAVPPEARDIIEQMREVACSLVAKVAEVVEGHDVELAAALAREDDAMDALHRKLFSVVLSPQWSRGTGAAIDLTLLGRYFERFGDHAVAVAGRTIFISTGNDPRRLGPIQGVVPADERRRA